MVSLVDTLEPATIATIGRRGVLRAAPSASSSAASNGPAQAILANLAIPCVVASARCAVPKASLTYTSHKAAIFCARSSSFFFSPTLPRQFSSSTTLPGAISTPSTQLVLSGTTRPNNSLMRFAIGASESSGFNSPSVGRPRCEVTITAAPFSSANLIAGIEARMRVSSVMFPASSCGTFKSARINTRWLDRSRSARRLKFICYRQSRGGQKTAITGRPEFFVRPHRIGQVRSAISRGWLRWRCPFRACTR